MPSPLKRVVSAALGIRPGEGHLVGLLLLLSFCVGTAKVFTMTASNTLFLAYFDAGSLPYAYITTAVVVPLVGLVMLRVEARAPFVSRVIGTLVFLAVTQVALRLLVAVAPGKVPSLGLMIWFEVEWVLTNIIFYGAMGRLLTVRQLKRLFGLVTVGEVLAMMLGGFLIQFILKILTTPDLLLFAAAAHVVGLTTFITILRRYRARLMETSADGQGKSSGAPQTKTKKHRGEYTWLIYAVIVFAFFSYYVIDNAFYERAQIRFPESQQLASFLGQFFAVFGLLNLVIKTFVSGQWLARFGIFGSLAATPFFVGISASGVIVAGLFFSLPMLVFWLMMVTKLLERVAVDSLYRPGYVALFQPLEAAERSRVQTKAETMVSQLAGGVAGGVLLMLNKVLHFTAVELCIVGVVVCALWIAASALAARGYQSAVADALTRRGLKGTDLSLEDPTTLKILVRRLSSNHPVEVTYCLDLLEEARYPGLPKRLRELIDHEDTDVRVAVYAKIEALASPSFIVDLIPRLDVEESPEGRTRLLRAIAASDENIAFDLLLPFCDDERPEMRLGALVGLLRYCGLEGAVAAGSQLLEMQNSSSGADRRFAARILGEIEVRTFYRGLLPLLEDEAMDVRREAIRAAGHLGNPRLWPLVIADLGDLTLRPVAVRALLRASESALPSMEEAYTDLTRKADRSRLVRMYGRIRGRRATALLKDKLDVDDLDLRKDVLFALHQCGFHLRPGDSTDLNKLLHEELRYATRVLSARLDMGEGEETKMLCLALDDELTKIRERAFFLLSFRYSARTMLEIWENFRHGSVNRKAFAVELFDNTVDREHKVLLLPLLEELSAEERLRSLEAVFPHEAVRVDRRVEEIACNEGRWRNEWLRACAEHSRGEGRDTEEFSTVEKVEVLREVSIFSELPGEVISEIAARVEDLTLETGEPFIHQGEMGTAMFVVAKGRVRIHSRERTEAELGAGDIVGELAALSSQPRTASVMSIDRAHLFKLGQTTLYEVMGDRIEVARGICTVLCQRLRTALAEGKGVADVVSDNVTQTRATTMARDFGEALSDLDRMIVLKTASIFAKMPDSILADIAQRTKVIFLERGETLFKKDDLGTELFVVVDGEVKVHDGGREIARLGERAVFGELAAFSSEPRTASVTARKETRLLVLDQESLYELMWDQIDVVRGLMQVLVSRLTHISG